MSNLLQVIRSKPEALNRKGTQPLILEFNVDPQTAPYLVSSSAGIMWIDHPHSTGDKFLVRAAVRDKVTPGELFWACAKGIYEKSLECQWGSAHPFTEDGLEAAIDHVESYDLGQVDILVAPTTPEKKRPLWLMDRDLGNRIRVSSWVPDNCAIVVPSERQFVGLLVHLTATKVAAVVHNASRGFAMCWNPEKS